MSSDGTQDNMIIFDDCDPFWCPDCGLPREVCTCEEGREEELEEDDSHTDEEEDLEIFSILK